jgi:hypothetical protein
MSVGTAAIAAAVTLNTRNIVISGDLAWFRKLVTLTVSGVTGHTAANLVAFLYRNATLVALASSPTDSGGGVCVFSLDLNTAELEDFMDVESGEPRDFDLFIYDSEATSLELLGQCRFEVLGNRDYAAVSPIPPLSSTTVFIGSFAFYNGKTYLRSSTDGLYYEFAAYGAGQTVSDALSTTGITIPGAP